MARQITFLLVRGLLGLLRLGPTPDEKDVEIAVLRRQLAVLRRQVAPLLAGGQGAVRHARPSAQPGAVGELPGDAGDAAALAPRARGSVLDLPKTWRARGQFPGRRGRRPRTPLGTGEPGWGYLRIVGGVRQARRRRVGDQRADRPPRSPPPGGTADIGPTRPSNSWDSELIPPNFSNREVAPFRR
jgi:hypothetical protein